MISNIIFVLAVMYVTNASVIMVNVFDDAPETNIAQEPQDCNFRACDQLCRRLGFPSGACINGRCKCDNFLNADAPETKAAQEPQECNFRACDQQCRRLGFPSGACFNDRCKCDIILNANKLFKVSSPILNAFSGKDDESNGISRATKGYPSSTTNTCSLRDCESKCKRHSLAGGFCAGNTCFCH